MTDWTTTSRGDRVAYDRYGDGPGVVFVAGAGPDRAGDPVTTETARILGGLGATAVVFDRLGRNESRADGTLDLDREVAAIAAVIEAAGGTAVLVGHSSGCALSLVAADRGLPADGLVLWEAPIAGDPDRTREWVDGFTGLLDRGELEDAQAWYMRDMPPEWLEGARRSPAWPHIYGQSPSMRADAEALLWATTSDPRATFSRIRVPVLSVAGTETFDEMLRSSALIAESIPGATAERLAGAHHSWQPDAMAHRISAFLGVTSPTPSSTSEGAPR